MAIGVAEAANHVEYPTCSRSDKVSGTGPVVVDHGDGAVRVEGGRRWCCSGIGEGATERAFEGFSLSTHMLEIAHQWKGRHCCLEGEK